MGMKPTIKKTLYDYCMTPASQVFPHFKLGVVIFFWGLIVIYTGSQLLSPSIVQELVVLLGLLLIGVGFLIAITAQIRMLAGRVLRFFIQK